MHMFYFVIQHIHLDKKCPKLRKNHQITKKHSAKGNAEANRWHM